MAKNLILWLVIAVVLMSVFQSFGPSESNGRKVDYLSLIHILTKHGQRLLVAKGGWHGLGNTRFKSSASSISSSSSSRLSPGVPLVFCRGVRLTDDLKRVLPLSLIHI